MPEAASFKSDSGDWTLSWDTTIGYGQGWRVSPLDCRLVAIANGGCGYSPNIDDGDLNYPKNATFSEALSGTTELALNYKDKFGAFVRASGLYDWKVMDDATGRTPLSATTPRASSAATCACWMPSATCASTWAPCRPSCVSAGRW